MTPQLSVIHGQPTPTETAAALAAAHRLIQERDRSVAAGDASLTEASRWSAQ